MRFPLPSDIFPRLRLSTEDKTALTSLAQVVIDGALEQHHEVYEVQKGVVDKRHWKKLRQSDNVTVYKQRSTSGEEASAIINTQAPTTLPSLLTVGHVEGNLDDVMYGISANSFEAMRIKSSYVDDRIVDCAILATLVSPTRVEPLRCVQLKWVVKGRRAFARPFIRFRDAVYIESTGILTKSTGERIGYQLHHSVAVSGIRELTELDIVRGQISLCCLYQQTDERTVRVFTTSFVDPAGNLNPSYAARAMAVTLTSVSRLTHCACMKKLSWLLKTSVCATPVCEERPQGCLLCNRQQTNAKKSCRACHARVCSGCREIKRLSFISAESGNVVQYDVSFCKLCLHKAAYTSALDIAAHENANCSDHIVDTDMTLDDARDSPIVSHGGLLSVTAQFDEMSLVSTSSFRIESEEASKHHSQRRRTYPSWMM